MEPQPEAGRHVVTVTIDRPPISVSIAREQVDGDLAIARDTLADPTVWRLQLLPRTARKILDFGSAGTPRSRVLEDATRWLAQATALLAAGISGRSGTLRLGDREVAIREPQADALSAWELAQGLLASFVARDDASREVLTAFDPDRLRGGPVESDDLAFEWCRALQAFARGETDLDEAVRAVRDAGRPERLRIAKLGPGRLTPLDAEALLAIAQGDRTRFADALTKAVWAWQAWHTAPGPKGTATGWVALGPLALACVAHDRGMEVPVRSEYLPEALIERRYTD